MNPFAKPEETSSYEWPEFPKPESEISEYTNVEGVIEFQLKSFNPDEPAFDPTAQTTPVVHPVLLQDFKQILPSPQA
ncbi:MAG TPA: hypothetical protein VMV05_04145 [bacterium]|nr:hypothetical protein [bacterium]